MTKRIISFVICLAVFVTTIAVGAVIGNKANSANVELPTNAPNDGSDIENMSVTTVGGEGSLLTYDKTIGEYILTGDVTVTKANEATNATYQALVSVFENTAYATDAKILDAKGHTITTEISLFDKIGNCTIKNLNVVGTSITIDKNDFVTVMDNNKAFGVIASYAHRHVIFENVNVDVDLSYSGNSSTTQISIGAFVGYAGVYRMENCKNDGNVTVTPSSCGTLSVGGFFGYKDEACGILMENCINNGNITAIKSGGRIGDCYAGGFSGVSYGVYDIINSSLNTGNVIAVQDTHNAARVGGFVGHCFAVVPTDCINLGDVSFTSTTTTYDGSIGKYRVGGIVGNGHYNSPFIRCINAGDITLTAANSDKSTAGGLSPWRQSGTSTFIDCVNLGDVQVIEGNSNTLKVGSGITPHNDMRYTIFVNCYTVKTTHEFNQFINQMPDTVNGVSGSVSDRYYITVPASVETYLEKVKTEQINDAKTVIKTILEMAEYDNRYAHNKDDGMSFKSTVIG